MLDTNRRVTAYPKKPKNIILFFSDKDPSGVARDGIAKPPEGDGTSKNVNIFLQK